VRFDLLLICTDGHPAVCSCFSPPLGEPPAAEKTERTKRLLFETTSRRVDRSLTVVSGPDWELLPPWRIFIRFVVGGVSVVTSPAFADYAPGKEMAIE